MRRSSEPVRPQQGRAEIDEQARRHGEPQDQVKHGNPSHPFSGANAKGKGRKDRKAKGEIGEVQHGSTPQDQARTMLRSRVKALFGKRPARVKAA